MLLARAARKLQVVDERIATAELQTATQVAVKARGSGTTVLHLWFADPADASRDKVFGYLLRVQPDPAIARATRRWPTRSTRCSRTAT